MADGAYRSQIDRLIRERSGEVVLNGSHGHAAVIFERMFARAQSSVKILTRTFDPRIYGTVATIDQAELFLGMPTRIAQILIEEPIGVSVSQHPFLHRLLKYKNLEVRVVPQHLRSPIQINFAVMDDFGLRFEKDTTEATAFATFGNTDLAGNLISLFDRIWGISELLSGVRVLESADA